MLLPNVRIDIHENIRIYKNIFHRLFFSSILIGFYWRDASPSEPFGLTLLYLKVLTRYCLEAGLAAVNKVIGGLRGHVQVRIILVREAEIDIACEHVDAR